MLYRTIMRMIEKGNTEGLEDKVDIFYAAGKLTDFEYNDIMKSLHGEPDTSAEG